MISRFRKRLDFLFITSPRSKVVDDFKEELLDVLMERYNEFLNLGFDSQTAYKNAWATLSDFKDAIKDIRKQAISDISKVKIKQIISSILAYWMLVILVFLSISFAGDAWSWSWKLPVYASFLFIAVAIAFVFIVCKAKGKNLVCAILIWLFAINACSAIYLIMGLGFNLWHPGWIVFLIGINFAYITNVALLWNVKNRLTKKIDAVVIAFLTCVNIYLVVSLSANKSLWSFSWLIFVAFLFLLYLGIFIDNIIEKKNIQKQKENKVKNEDSVNADEADE